MLNSRIQIILILMRMLESEWLSYHTLSAITGMCGSILAVTIPPGTSQGKSRPSGLGDGEFFKYFCSSSRRKSKKKYVHVQGLMDHVMSTNLVEF